VHYASFDASDPGGAAIEDVTYAPALASAPSLGCADAAMVAANCSRESLIAFIDGQTSGDNRQGLNAALLDGHSPLNILKEIPEPTAQFDYSPLWDIHLVQWNNSVPVTSRPRQTDFDGTIAGRHHRWHRGAIPRVRDTRKPDRPAEEPCPQDWLLR
jgi:hypothetical protein